MARNTASPVLLLALFLALFLVVSEAQSSCSSYSFSNNRVYASCTALPVLGCFLHWTYNATDGSADIAFRATGVNPSSNWVAWAINPTGSGMIGAQALVALGSSSGSIKPYTSAVSSYGTTLAVSNLSFAVSDLTAESSGSEIAIFAKVVLPDDKTTVNHVWQVGPLSGSSPQGHKTGNGVANENSKGTLNFLSGEVAAGGSSGSRQRKKNVHGVLNAVSWGILMPIGAIIARYLRVFKSADPAWFYLHIACQFSAYVVGVAGWGTGLKLGSESSGIIYHAHRNIGITLFVLATLQVFALLLRPNKDHKFRFYWNIYHHVIGYAVIILSVINVFKGLDILEPSKKWKRAYIGVIIFLGCVAVLLEAVTWFVVLRRKKKLGSSEQKSPHRGNEVNGNGYGMRSQPGV